MNRRERRAHWQASQRLASRSVLGRSGAETACPATPPEPSAPACPKIDLTIDKLVVRGFQKRHAYRIAAAFERSLIERLRAEDLPDALRLRGSSTSICLAPLTLHRPNDPADIGEELAASIVAFKCNTRYPGGLR